MFISNGHKDLHTLVISKWFLTASTEHPESCLIPALYHNTGLCACSVHYC